MGDPCEGVWSLPPQTKSPRYGPDPSQVLVPRLPRKQSCPLIIKMDAVIESKLPQKLEKVAHRRENVDLIILELLFQIKYQLL